MKKLALIVLAGLLTQTLAAREWHVSVKGSNKNDGSASKPFRTISTAAQAAHPGDVITVYEGTYRERVTPPRGGVSDSKRIVYQAARGERVVIKGSEVVSANTTLTRILLTATGSIEWAWITIRGRSISTADPCLKRALSMR
jgi:hypothetical protein